MHFVASYLRRVTTLPGKSWNLVRPFSRPGSHGKQQRSWKVMENDDDVLEFFVTRIFVCVNIILFVVSLVLLTDWLTRNWKYIFILVSIHKSCVVLKKICCADRSSKFIFFWSCKSHGKSLLKKSGHPVYGLSNYFITGKTFVIFDVEQLVVLCDLWLMLIFIVRQHTIAVLSVIWYCYVGLLFVHNKLVL